MIYNWHDVLYCSMFYYVSITWADTPVGHSRRREDNERRNLRDRSIRERHRVQRCSTRVATRAASHARRALDRRNSNKSNNSSISVSYQDSLEQLITYFNDAIQGFNQHAIEFKHSSWHLLRSQRTRSHRGTGRRRGRSASEHLPGIRPLRWRGGFYLARVIKLCSEFMLLNGMILGATFRTGRGGQEVTPKLYRLLAFLCWLWSHTTVETPMYIKLVIVQSSTL